MNPKKKVRQLTSTIVSNFSNFQLMKLSEREFVLHFILFIFLNPDVNREVIVDLHFKASGKRNNAKKKTVA